MSLKIIKKYTVFKDKNIEFAYGAYQQIDIKKMEVKRTTRYWDKIQKWQIKSLCFSEKRGFYTQMLSEYENPKELLYRPHGYYGYTSDSINIPGMGIRITIQANFGFRTTSYLRAVVENDEYRILDFDKSNLYVLRKCSVKTLCVPKYDWNALFNKIISACGEAIARQYNTSFLEYIKELEEMLDKDEIFIKGELEDEKTIRWAGSFIILLFAGTKIRDLLEAIELAKPLDSFLLNHMLNLCRKYIVKAKSQEYDINDSRLQQLSESLFAIHKFMNQNAAGVDFFAYFTTTIQ